MITEDDDRRYKLPPLPEAPFCGAAEAQRRRAAWERRLHAQRAADGLPRLGTGLDKLGRPTCSR